MKGGRKNKSSVNPPWFQSMGHCIFCLRKVNSSVLSKPSSSGSRDLHCDDGEDLRVVPEAVVVSPNFNNILNEIWPFMLTKSSGSKVLRLENVLEHPLESKASSNLTMPTTTSFTFPQLPTICQFCADKVQVCGDLMNTLRLKMKELRGIISNSKKGGRFSWRGEQFERNLRCKDALLGEDAVTSVLNFYNSLGCSSDEENCAAPVQQAPPVFGRSDDDDDDDKESSPGQLSPVPGTSENKHKGGSKLKLTKMEKDQFNESDSEMDLDQEGSVNREDDEADKGPQGYSIYIKCEEEEEEDKSSFYSFSTTGENDFDEAMSSSCTDGNEDCGLHSLVKVECDPNKTSMTLRTRKKQKLSTETARHSLGALSKKHPCAVEGCNGKFATKYYLYKHLCSKHPEALKFPCSSCGTSFISEICRLEHLNTCTKYAKEKKSKRQAEGQTKEQSCDICGIKLSASKTLAHVEGHVGDYAMKCPNDACPHVYSTYYSYMYHILRSYKCKDALGNGQGFTCDTCGFKTDSRLALHGHLTDFHERSADKNFKCPITSCDKSFCVRQSVHFHLKNHLFRDKSLQKCEHCDIKIKTQEMSEHLRTEHDAPEIVKCQQCPFSFSSRVSLLEHVNDHRKIGMLCDICCDDVKYAKHPDLLEHYRTAHNVTAKQFVCEHCNQAFWKRCTWMDHLRRKHPKEDEVPSKKKNTFPCDICSNKVEFKTAATLIAHKINVHGDSPFTCSTCGVTFARKQQLSNHEKEHGAGIVIKKKFKCQVEGCTKICPNKFHLKRHVARMHDGEKNYVCHLCGKPFSENSQLKQHHSDVHLGIRPFVCEVCGESFCSSSTFKGHKLIHANLRPFACTICDQRFRQHGVLKRHLDAHERKGKDFKPNGPMKQIRKRKGQ